MSPLTWFESAEDQLGKWSKAAEYYYKAHRTKALLVLGSALSALLLSTMYIIWYDPLPHAWGAAYILFLFLLSGMFWILNRGWSPRSQRPASVRLADQRHAVSCIAIALYGYFFHVLSMLPLLLAVWRERNWMLLGVAFAALAVLSLLFVLKIHLERQRLMAHRKPAQP